MTVPSTSSPVRRLGLLALLAIFALALAARLAHAHVAAGQGLLDGLFLDSRWYADRAADIRLGRDAGGAPYLLSPLYPYVLALFVDAGGALDIDAVRFWQSIAGAGAAVMAALLADRIGGRAHGWVAGVAAALLGPSIHYGAFVLTPALQAFLVMLGLVLATLELPRGRPRLAFFLAGAAFGLASAVHPTSLFAALGVCLALAWRGRVWRRTAKRASAWRRGVAFTGGILLAIAPFTVRNVVQSGEPILLSANGGMNFWIGNNANADGVFEAPERYDARADPVGRDIAARALGREPSWSESSRWWKLRALADIGADPLRWLELFARKVLLFGHAREIRQVGDGFDWYAERSWPLTFPLDARIVLLFALFAPFVMRANGRGARELALPLGALLLYALGVCAFFVSGRYRAPILPLAVLLAAVGVVETWRLVASGALVRSRLARIPVVAFVAVLVATQWLYTGPLAFPTTGGVEDRNLGIQLAQRGEHAQAVAQFERALAARDDAVTRTNLAMTLHALGRVDEAVAQCRRALELDPAQAETWFTLATMLLRAKSDWAGAEDGFRRAIELQPRHAAAHCNLGAVLMQKGDLEGAERELQRALDLATPQDPWRAGAESGLQAIRAARAAPPSPPAPR